MEDAGVGWSVVGGKEVQEGGEGGERGRGGRWRTRTLPPNPIPHPPTLTHTSHTYHYMPPHTHTPHIHSAPYQAQHPMTLGPAPSPLTSTPHPPASACLNAPTTASTTSGAGGCADAAA